MHSRFAITIVQVQTIRHQLAGLNFHANKGSREILVAGQETEAE